MVSWHLEGDVEGAIVHLAAPTGFVCAHRRLATYQRKGGITNPTRAAMIPPSTANASPHVKIATSTPRTLPRRRRSRGLVRDEIAKAFKALAAYARERVAQSRQAQLARERDDLGRSR